MAKIYEKMGAKMYLVNTYKNVRTLHKNRTACYAMKMLYQYEEFDSEEQACQLFNGNYKKCQVCFSEDKISKGAINK